VAIQLSATTSARKEGKTLSHKNFDATPASTISARLSHWPFARLQPPAQQSLINGLTDLDATMFSVCLLAKHKQKSIPTKVKRAIAPVWLVHSHTCSPFSVPTNRGNLHYIMFVDNYMPSSTVYLLPDMKKETCITSYQQPQAKVAVRNYNIKGFRGENGRGEYDNMLYRGLLATRGTALEFGSRDAYQQHGDAERMIHTITGRARAMILDSQAALEFLVKAVTTTVHLN